MSSPASPEPDDGVARAVSIVLLVLAAELAVLIVTGILLFFFYRPSGTASWPDLGVPGRYSVVRFADAIRVTHRVDSRVFTPTAIAAAVLLLIAAGPARRRWRGGAIGAGLAIGTLAASFTGFLLPWDQLALWAVTVGTNMEGFRPLFGDQVRFVLIGSVEIGRDTIIRWLLVHVALGVVLGALLALAWRGNRLPRSRARSTSAAGMTPASTASNGDVGER